MTSTPGALLRRRLEQRAGILVPGAGNALAARVIETLGFECVYLSGAGLTNSYYGMPDLGFIGLRQDGIRGTAEFRQVYLGRERVARNQRCGCQGQAEPVCNAHFHHDRNILVRVTWDR